MAAHHSNRKKKRNKFQNIVALLGKGRVDIAKNEITQTISLNCFYDGLFCIYLRLKLDFVQKELNKNEGMSPGEYLY